LKTKKIRNMKKILISSLFVAALSFLFVGCLKDKGFDDFQYGINDPDTQPPGVGFNYGSKAKNDYGLDVSSAPQTVTGLTTVKMLTGIKTKADVVVTLTNTTTASVAAYNTANGTSYLEMPSSLYTVPATIAIPAGTPYQDFPLTISSTLTLNPNRQYAVAITISAVDGGYKIADNFKTLFLLFSIKNKYDGKYTMTGRFYHPSVEPTMNPPFSFNVECQTAGPNSVNVYWPLYGGFYTPLSSGGAPICCFASQTLSMSVDPATNIATVYNGDPAGTVVYSQGTSSGSFGYPVYNPSVWDDAAKQFKLSFGYSLGPSGDLVTGQSRFWITVLTRTGPR
jgi:hypothetical protein